MENYEMVFSIILYVLGSILLVTLIIFVIKLMSTLKKVDDAIDDYNEKSKKLDGLFSIIDTTTDTISALSDRLVGVLIKGVSNLFKRKKKEDESDE